MCVPHDDVTVTGNVLLRGVANIETLLSLKSLLSAEIPLGISNSLRSNDGYLWHKLITLKLSLIIFDICIVLTKPSLIVKTFEGVQG